MNTYTVGDAILIEVDVRNESDISKVNASFNKVDDAGNVAIFMQADGGDQPMATVVLTKIVTEQLVPGEYFCQYLEVFGTKRNRKLLNPDIRFKIEYTRRS